MKIIHTLPLIAFTLAACNKDDVIPAEVPTDGRRPITAQSSAYQNMVYDYTPAPGQFINNPKSGFTGEETSPASACAYALERLTSKSHVSLGSFGGYIVVGFDHSIANNHSGYDFLIQGNAFNSNPGASNEPGIVWVMQDTNGNSIPDDIWYQLKGSEYDKSTTLKNYSVTYFRPEGAEMAVMWRDSENNTGTVNYNGSQHSQPYYYPAWIAADSYTLTGTRLEARNEMDPTTGMWSNMSYDWGYADNMGSDVAMNPTGEGGMGQRNGFRISNAVDAQGNSVNLEYIDFIKVQTGVLSQSGILGEISTEVFSFIDNSLINRK